MDIYSEVALAFGVFAFSFWATRKFLQAGAERAGDLMDEDYNGEDQ